MPERRSPPFQPDSLEGIREGRKTQTRRVVKPQPTIRPDLFPTELEDMVPGRMESKKGVFVVEESPGVYHCLGKKNFAQEFSPHGQLGTVWALTEPLHPAGMKCLNGGADIAVAAYPDGDFVIDRRHRDGRIVPWKWKVKKLSSMFMPRWAARDYLTLLDVRVERLQDIILSADDMMAEGVIWDADALIIGPCEADAGDLIEQFRERWDSVNGKRHAWEKNEFVWVETFGNYVREGGRKMENKT